MLKTETLKISRMKRLLFFLLASCFPVLLVAAPPMVERWGVFEIELPGPRAGNPFTEVRFEAEFTDGHRTVLVPGFYDGDGIYRIRFSPETEGEWRYETKSNRWDLTGKRGAFTAVAPSPDNHGPVRIFNTYH